MRMASGTAAEHELLVVELALYHDTVELVLDAVYVLLARYELRHYAHHDFAVGNLLHMRHELYAAPLLVGEPYVGIVHRRDAVGEYPLRLDIAAEGVHGDDDELEERIVTVDVERRIALGEAQILCHAQGLVIGHLLVEDLRKDEVRRAVQDSLHRNEQVVVIVLLEIPYDRNAAAGRGVVQQRRRGLALQLYKLPYVVGKHLLVARHGRDAVRQCALDDVVCRLRIVDKLHDEIDLRIVEDIVGIVRKVGLHPARLVYVAHAYAFYVCVTRFDLVQYVEKAAADVSETEQSYCKLF